VGAAIFAGPVIAPAFLGLVPVVLAVAGNLRRRTVSWNVLILPLALTALGLSPYNPPPCKALRLLRAFRVRLLVQGEIVTASGPDGQFLFDTGAQKLYWDLDGIGTDPAVLIATLANVNSLGTSDFLVV